MRLILGVRRDNSGENLRFAAQLGVDGVMSRLRPNETSHGYYEYAPLVSLRSQVESHGLTLEALSLIPWHLCYKWMLGLPGRDEQIEYLQESIRNMGAAGVPVLVFNMHGLRFYRTSRHTLGRAGALATSFDMDRVRDAPLMTVGAGADTSTIPADQRRPISDEEMWDNYTYLLKAIVPVAEKAGVKLALHPDDPPVPSIAGVARIMRSPEAFRRAMEIVPSDALGLKFCVGCFAEMGANVAEEARYFGARNKIFLVDFRNVRGTLECFAETFLDNGDVDMFEVIRAFKESGFDGPIGPDHAMHIVGDSPGAHRYWAYAAGHMRALLQAADSLA